MSDCPPTADFTLGSTTSCLFEGEFELDSLRSDATAEQRAIDALTAEIATCDAELARLAELRELETRETTHCGREAQKLAGVNDQLRKNLDSVKKLRDAGRKKIGTLLSQWATEKSQREKILNHQRERCCDIMKFDNSESRNFVCELDHLKMDLVRRVRSKFVRNADLAAQFEKEMLQNPNLPFDSLESFKLFILDLNDKCQNLKLCSHRDKTITEEESGLCLTGDSSTLSSETVAKSSSEPSHSDSRSHENEPNRPTVELKELEDVAPKKTEEPPRTVAVPPQSNDDEICEFKRPAATFSFSRDSKNRPAEQRTCESVPQMQMPDAPSKAESACALLSSKAESASIAENADDCPKTQVTVPKAPEVAENAASFTLDGYFEGVSKSPLEIDTFASSDLQETNNTAAPDNSNVSFDNLNFSFEESSGANFALISNSPIDACGSGSSFFTSTDFGAANGAENASVEPVAASNNGLLF